MRSLSGYRKSIHAAEIDSDGTWAVSYGDMITLLLTFFILFFNINKGKNSEKPLQDSLIQHLRMELLSPSASSTAAPIDSNLLKDLGARVEKVGSYVLVDFPGVSFYDFRKIDLTKDGILALERFAHAFVPYAGRYQLMIRSFTDDRPVRNLKEGVHRYRDNMELSALRAVAAARVLQHSGIPLMKMRPSGFGELPLSPELSKKLTSSQGTPLARKVVFVIEPEIQGGGV